MDLRFASSAGIRMNSVGRGRSAWRAEGLPLKSWENGLNRWDGERSEGPRSIVFSPVCHTIAYEAFGDDQGDVLLMRVRRYNMNELSESSDRLTGPGLENAGENRRANPDERTLGGFEAESFGEDRELDTYIFPVFKISEDLGSAEANFVRIMATGIWGGVQPLLTELKVSTPTMTVLVTDDIMGSADSEGTRIGIGPDRRSGVERVGGVVTGKTLLSDDDREAVILLAKDLLVMDGFGQMQAAIAIAHEFSHVIYGLVRNATVGIGPNCWLPWEVAEVIAIVAAEEFRCDRLALQIVAPIITATDDEGNEVPLSQVGGSSYLNGVVSALDEVSPYLEETILQYRSHERSVQKMQQMWNEVVRISEGIVIFLSHAEAYNDLDEPLIAGIGHRGASLLGPIGPLFEYLRAAPLLPEADEWAQDREALKRIGREGLMATWAQLGLNPRPDGDGMYIEVTNPKI